jgi:hypothetical protein
MACRRDRKEEEDKQGHEQEKQEETKKKGEAVLQAGCVGWAALHLATLAQKKKASSGKDAVSDEGGEADNEGASDGQVSAHLFAFLHLVKSSRYAALSRGRRRAASPCCTSQTT